MAKPEESYKRPSMWRHPRVLRKRLLRSWPLLIWLGAIIVAVQLYQGSVRLTAMVGAVETLAEPVAPLETARLLNIHVRIGDRVKAGDLLATMDTTLFDARAAIEEAQLIEAEGTVQDYQQRVLEFVRTFENAVDDVHFNLENLKLDQVRDTSVLDVLREELARLDVLRQKGLIGESELAALRPEVVSLEQTVAGYPALIALHAERLKDAETDLRSMRALLSEGHEGELDVLGTIREMRRATAEIVRTSQHWRQIQRANYELRAVRDGIVSRIDHQPGDVVSAGEVVLTVISENPRRVVGFLPEIHLGDVLAGQQVTVWRQSSRGERIAAVVESIAPEIEALPGRVSPIRGQALRGRRVVLICTGDVHLIPGETVRIQLSPPSFTWWFAELFGN